MEVSILTRTPLVHDKIHDVFTFADVGNNERHGVRLKKKIGWIPEARVQAVFSHGGRELKSGTTFCDHTYGYLSCLKSGIDQAVDEAARYGITRDSTLVLQCRATIEWTPALSDTARILSTGATEYRCPPNGWFTDYEGIEDEIRRFRRGHDEWPSKAISLSAKTEPLSGIIWSSLDDETANDAALDAFRKAATILISNDQS